MGASRIHLLFLAGTLLLPGCTRETPRSERQRMVGVWKIVTLEDNGFVLPKGLRPGVDVTITEQHFTITDALGSQVKMTYEVQPGLSPKTIDMYGMDAPSKKGQESGPHRSHGIYAVEGNRLKLCTTEFSRPRPTEFKSAAGSGHMLMILEREK